MKLLLSYRSLAINSFRGMYINCGISSCGVSIIACPTGSLGNLLRSSCGMLMLFATTVMSCALLSVCIIRIFVFFNTLGWSEEGDCVTIIRPRRRLRASASIAGIVRVSLDAMLWASSMTTIVFSCFPLLSAV